jgi:hypothetical protein
MIEFQKHTKITQLEKNRFEVEEFGMFGELKESA